MICSNRPSEAHLRITLLEHCIHIANEARELTALLVLLSYYSHIAGSMHQHTYFGARI